MIGFDRKHIRKKFSFEASHNLPKHKGKCKNLHGHSQTLSVELAGIVDPESGMIIDFYDFKQIVNELIIDKLDHSHLNNIIPNPTAENIIDLIGNTLTPAFLKLNILVYQLILAETEGNEVIWNYWNYAENKIKC
jgi:6-pyruvoyltetrahydropterin/6-carboxytetrahydropterin synthase